MPVKAKEKPAQGEAVKLAEENHRLTEENRKLKRIEREREVAFFLSELREDGQVTPAMEDAGLEQALISAEENPLMVVFPDGHSVPLSTILHEVLRALPVSFRCGESVPREEQTAELTPEEKEIAKQLGLTVEEYAEIKKA